LRPHAQEARARLRSNARDVRKVGAIGAQKQSQYSKGQNLQSKRFLGHSVLSIYTLKLLALISDLSIQ